MYARYTTYLRDLMLNEQAKAALDKALSTYPLYSPQNPLLKDLIPTREELNRKLLNHYKYREIGLETPGRFLDELQITMEEIMPRYNELYKTVEIMAELPSPFDNVDVIEEVTEKRTTQTSSEGSSQSQNNGNASEESSSQSSQTLNNKRLEADTPQDEINVATKDIDSVSYASNATWDENISEGNGSGSSSRTSTDSSTASSEGSSQSSDSFERTYKKTGNQGVNTYAHDMNEFRTSIIDVTEQIIEDERIAVLFMMVY